jgi:lipopolysaccharide transport system ATP-binding protein
VKQIIKIRGLGKQYRLGRRRTYRTLRETMVDAVTAPLSYTRSALRRGNPSLAKYREPDTIWALRDLSLDIEEGEVLGVIGSNGAGKSTLLKILSRITEPTTGRIDLYGRVGSLLEVGTGFHPELTGRENIFLSGAILGMRRHEIERKFDEIVAFAEIDKFVDTTVKHYSSGMYVRLAFAVAAHLEPEILLVDEVLAVGDAAFQKKCLGKMGDVARQGRTIVFISHNMASIESLCSTCIYIAAGVLEDCGQPRDVITKYMTSQNGANSGRVLLVKHPGRRPGAAALLKSIEIRSHSGVIAGAHHMGDGLTIVVNFGSTTPLRPVLGLAVKTIQGIPVFAVSDRFSMQMNVDHQISSGTIVCEIQKLQLMPGQYNIDVYIGDQVGDLDVVFDAISFEVLPADLLESGRLPPSVFGPMFCAANFKLIEESLPR